MKKINSLLLFLILTLLVLIGCMTFFVMREPDVRTVIAAPVSTEPSPTEALPTETTGETMTEESFETAENSTDFSTEAVTEATTEAATEAPASAFANKLVVTATQFLNIRENPDTGAKVLGKIYHGSIAEVQDQQNNFSKITSGEVTGWVSNDYVVFGAEAENYVAENGTFTATVHASSLNVREKPNTTSRVLATVEKDQVFIVKEKMDNWVQIYYTTDIIGYLSTEYVSIELSQGKAISVEEENELIGQIKPTEPETTKVPETTKAPETKPTKPDKTTAADETTASTAAETTEAPTTPAPTESESEGEVVVDDLQLLAALVQAEAGYNYEACLGVANVVLNRKNSPRYPNTIRDVIYQKNQFSPVSSGYLDKILQNGPAKVAKEAAADALNGVNNLDDTYYRFIGAAHADRDNYTKYQEIGGNVFYIK